MNLINVTICVFVIISLFFIGCDGNGGNNMPTDDCMDASNNSSILEQNMDCPTGALVQICNNFICDLDSIINAVLFTAQTCDPTSCFDFTCQLTDFGTLNDFGIGDFSIVTISGNRITGTVLVTDAETEEITEFDFDCSPIVQ